MRILVTGGAGFIGSHIVERFIADGHRVLVVDNLTTGKVENIDDRAAFEHIDLLDFPSIERVMKQFRPEVVDHHAAQIDVRTSVAEPVMDAQTNVLASVHLFHLAVRVEAKGILFASSGGTIYGETPQPAHESSAKAPVCPYAAAKLAAEGYLFAMTATQSTVGLSLRYGNVYGPRQDPLGEAGVVAIFAAALTGGSQPRIFGDGTAVRDYVFVKDVAEANRLALESLLTSPRKGISVDDVALNIGSGSSTSVNELLAMETTALSSTIQPIHVEPRQGELQESRLCVRQAVKRIGFRAPTSLDLGIRQTLEWNSARSG